MDTSPLADDIKASTVRELAIIQQKDREIIDGKIGTILASLDEIKGNNKWITRGIIAMAGLTLLKIILGSIGVHIG